MPALLLGLLFSVNPSVLTVPVPPVEAAPLSIPQLEAIATSSAARYDLSRKATRQMLKVIQCESGWDTTVVSSTGDYGISQLNLSAHPEITKEEAFDPHFSLDWLAHEWSLGHQNLWVCYGQLFG